MGSSGYVVNPSSQDVPGMSQDVPHGILWTSSHPRTLVGLSKDVQTLVGNTGHEWFPENSYNKELVGLTFTAQLLHTQ